MEKARIKRLFERFKRGKRLSYTDGPYMISVGGYDCYWEFYVNGTSYIRNIAGNLEPCIQDKEDFLNYIKKVWEEV